MLLITQLVFADEIKVLELEYPSPKVTSTPSPIKLSNLENPKETLKQIDVPSDVVNLASGKGVTSSDPWPIIGELDMATDGDKESEDGYYVELGDGVQWIQIDLGEASEVYAIGLWHYHSQLRSYRDVIIQVSEDPEFSSEVTTVFNNDHDNSSGVGTGDNKAYLEKNYGRLIPVKGAVGRYVRFYSNGNTSDDLNHYIEVEVFGRSAKG
ncbi:discoidin domain-containing protein [Puniceicoccaceae bacterium K14]|nr:discoidin domain-containing protein [Puniceicoccaceae bacterium K14]